MQNTTADYKLEINKPSRSFECKITIGNNIYTNEDLVNLTLEFTQPQEGFSIGGTISKSLDLTLLNRGDIIYSTSQIKVEIGLKIGSKIEYILMGLFNIDDIEKTDYTTKFTAYDNMIKFETDYFSELGDKPTLQQVVNELSSKTGVEFTGSLPTYTVSKLDGFSCREVLSYVASICGGNALITRDGKFTIKTLNEVEKSIDGSNYFNYTREEVKYKVGQISCQVDENNILSKGSTGTDSMELAFENPWVTENILNDLYNKLNGLSYLGYSMKWQGDISLDPYDIITVTDVKNVVRKIPILSQKITYTGGLTSEIGAKGETKNKNSFSSSGSTTNKVNRAVIEQAIIKEALIEKANIKDVEAVSIRTQTLEAKTAKIEEAIVDVAHIKDLNAINANIQNLIAADATINNALINKADITELNAVKGTINVLDSKVGNIETLVNGNLSSENIQTGGITSDKLTIANGFITNAMIASLDVSKINAGNISTNKFRIVSDSGKMLIADNTIQIRDNNRVRVQIGKDASNDYNMYVWDSAGKLMFDATGLKADGIKNKIIRDDMISDNANIDGGKINISSLVTEINKDTNTSVIKSSKVQIDSLKQTLDVAFNSLKTQADSTKFLTESHSTTINVMQGQIATAINNTQIVKDGQTILLKDSYNRTVAKVDSINSTIGSHTTKINELTGSITSVDTKVNSVQRDLEGTKSTVSSHTSQISGLNSTVSTQGTSISQLQNQIKLKVESTEVNTIVNGAISKTAKSLDVMYYLSSSATSLSGGSWSTTAPTWTNGKYMWSKTVTTFVDGSKKESTPTCIAGATGANGSAGKGIKSIVEQYYLSTSNTTQTGGAWATSPPAWANGKYMWTRSVITYTDNSTTTTNPVCVSGSKGDTGAKGDKGATGAKGDKGDAGVGIGSVDVEYYLSTSATSLAGGSWSTTAPAWVNGKYMWSRTKTVTTTGVTTYSNPVCITGAKGATGATGTKGDKGDTGNTGATGQGISSITEEYYLSTSKTSQTGGSWTTTPPSWSTGKYVWTRSKIVYTNPASTAYTTPVCDSSWEAVNEVQVGGRNLAQRTSNSYSSPYTSFDGGTNKCPGLANVLTDGLRVGDIVTVRLVYKYTNIVATSGQTAGCWIQGSGNVTSWSAGAFSSSPRKTLSGSGEHEFLYSFKITADHLKNTSWSTAIRHDYVKSGSVQWKLYKVEKGNKATDWSPAPEDIDSSIANVQTQVTTTSNKVATIETNLSSITQRVSSTESTVSTHTTQLGTVDSRINTAKNSAISTAASDATTKANNAQSKALADAKSYTNGQITTVNKTITDKVAEIKTTTDSISQRVSSTESKITTVTTDFNNLQIGGTNLAADTNKGITGWLWGLQTGGKTITEVVENGIRCCKMVRDSVASTGWSYISYSRIGRSKYLPNRKYTVSFEVKASVVTGFNVVIQTGGAQYPLTDVGRTANTVVNSWVKLHAVITTKSTLPTNTGQVLYFSGMNSNPGVSYIFRNLKIEEGNKPTAWTPAPEDIDSSIEAVDSKVTTTSNKVATIETNLSSITSRVSSTESKVTTINGNVTSLQSRMNTAEQKITPTAITTTISSAITGGTGSISTTQFVMNKNGLTINNGALIIKNKAGKTVLSSDSNGNLLYTGALYAQVDSSHYAKLEPILTNNNKDVKLRLALVGSTEHSNFDVVNASGTILFKVGHGGVEIHKYLTLDTDQTGTYNTRCYWENGTYRPAVAEKALIGTNTYYFNSVYSRYFGRDRISGSYTTVQAGAVNIRTAYQGEGCYFDTAGYFRPAVNGAWANGNPNYRWSTVYTVNGVNAASDLRLKENVEYIQETNNTTLLFRKRNKITQEDMYNFIKDEFKLASYNYKGEKFEGNTELSYNLGFIAQDLKDSNVGRQFIIPPQEEEGAYSYNMGSYIGVLAGALRIAINKIESLENRIKVLESKGA